MKAQLLVLMSIFIVAGCSKPKQQPEDGRLHAEKFDLAAYKRDESKRVQARNLNLRRQSEALQEAAHTGDMKEFRKLLSDGANRTEALELAARAGELKLCRQLIAEGANVNHNVGGFSVIAFAALQHPEILQLLVDRDLNIRLRITWTGGRTGWWLIGDDSTLLHYAADEGSPETVRMLLKLGLDGNDRNATKQTPLHVAAFYGNGSIIQVLMAHSADDTARDDDGHVPRDLACSWRHNSHDGKLDEEEQLTVELLGGTVQTLCGGNIEAKFPAE